tara:strand:+ start:55 stop:753 length:699 start_codon:yes stop_codon:yes gene_type:complete
MQALHLGLSLTFLRASLDFSYAAWYNIGLQPQPQINTMPNHCSNTLSFTGKRSHCFDFARDHYRFPEAWDSNKPNKIKTTLDFSLCVPYPRERATSDGWYDYHIGNWGTKWNAYDVYPETFPEVIEGIEEDWTNDSASGSYSFSTAWSPPELWLKAVTKHYPGLSFLLTYEEPGADYCGFFKAHGGSFTEEDTRTCSEFAPEGVDYDDSDQAEAAWEQQSENIANFFEELSL